MAVCRDGRILARRRPISDAPQAPTQTTWRVVGISWGQGRIRRRTCKCFDSRTRRGAGRDCRRRSAPSQGFRANRGFTGPGPCCHPALHSIRMARRAACSRTRRQDRLVDTNGDFVFAPPAAGRRALPFAFHLYAPDLAAIAIANSLPPPYWPRSDARP